MGKRQPKVIFYKGKDRKWRWKMVAANGRRLCSPGESFSGLSKAEDNFQCVIRCVGGDEYGKFNVEYQP